MPEKRPPQIYSEPQAEPESFDNVVQIGGWLRPMPCPKCHSHLVVQVDQIECAYPVMGVRLPRNAVHLDFDERRTGVEAIGRFYRCRECVHEWPVELGTLFVEAGA